MKKGENKSEVGLLTSTLGGLRRNLTTESLFSKQAIEKAVKPF